MSAAPELLARAPMRPMQIIGIALCVLLNALDGFDVLSISFAAPGIAADWHVDRPALGIVLSMELIGMAAGSIVLGILADRIGRRPTILACLVAMALGMALAASASGIGTLSAIRLLTGFGIGGMLACTNAMTAELTSDRHRATAVALMAAGYPAGAILGGLAASSLLAHASWRAVFMLGAGATMVMIPLVLALLPESTAFLARQRGGDALGRLNAVLRRLGHAPVAALRAAGAEPHRTSIAALFGGGLGRVTGLLMVAYLAHTLTFYFILKWLPKIVVDLGHPSTVAGTVLVWANVGGLCGALTFSALSYRVAPRRLAIATLFASTLLVASFGQVGTGLGLLSLMAALAGFCTNAGVVGLYATLAAAFPARLRAGGTGVVIGTGRAGAAFGPIAAGALFGTGLGLPVVAAVMALGSLVAATALLRLPQAAPAA